MTSDERTLDCAVIGAGRRGLLAALQQQRAGKQFAVFDALPQPGGGDRTQRSNGFGCELGAFAFARGEVQPLLDLLEHAPQPIELDPAARHGHVWNGEALVPTQVEPVPISFHSGCEELWQACRRQLGAALRLGRGVDQVTRTADGWQFTLAGEVPTLVQTHELVLAVPAPAAARLLRAFDPALAGVADRAACSAHAFVFLGDREAIGDAVQGHGIVAADELPTALLEVINCSRSFAGRALPGRCLLRAELPNADPAATDDELVATALRELQRWTGRELRCGFTKVHRFTLPLRDGASAELGIRLRALPTRVGALTFAR